MMTVRVLIEFHDKDNFARIYHVGEIVQFNKERAKNLINLNIVESYRESKRVKASE